MNNSPEDRQCSSGVKAQRAIFENTSDRGLERWAFHDTKDPVVRYVRDRRLQFAISRIRLHLGKDLSKYTALTVCGGVGGEGTFLRKAGFGTVTNSDFSEYTLKICHQRDKELQTLWLNAESMDLQDNSYDVVLVQDGLHHLPRPVLGFNEMLRIARKAVIVLEPHTGFSAKLLGREWEEHDGVFNYVFRWNRSLLEQATKSQLLKQPSTIESHQIWDHSGSVHRMVRALGNGRLSRFAAKCIYACLTPLNFLGNNFIGVVIKHEDK
jgi:ubiquinone/menaquinone biosynthesis C-methylase UbiE